MRKPKVKAKSFVQDWTWRRAMYAILGVSTFIGAVAVITGFIHPVTEALVGDPPFASRTQFVELDKKSSSALQFLQQSTVSNAQDWYEQYRRTVIELQARIKRNPFDTVAARDLEFATRRRDYYRIQLDQAEKANQDLIDLMGQRTKQTGFK
jgi:hypothetical protein